MNYFCQAHKNQQYKLSTVSAFFVTNKREYVYPSSSGLWLRLFERGIFSRCEKDRLSYGDPRFMPVTHHPCALILNYELRFPVNPHNFFSIHFSVEELPLIAAVFFTAALFIRYGRDIRKMKNTVERGEAKRKQESR